MACFRANAPGSGEHHSLGVGKWFSLTWLSCQLIQPCSRFFGGGNLEEAELFDGGVAIGIHGHFSGDDNVSRAVFVLAEDDACERLGRVAGELGGPPTFQDDGPVIGDDVDGFQGSVISPEGCAEEGDADQDEGHSEEAEEVFEGSQIGHLEIGGGVGPEEGEGGPGNGEDERFRRIGCEIARDGHVHPLDALAGL